jgi:hypothetical protein
MILIIVLLVVIYGDRAILKSHYVSSLLSSLLWTEKLQSSTAKRKKVSLWYSKKQLFPMFLPLFGKACCYTIHILDNTARHTLDRTMNVFSQSVHFQRGTQNETRSGIIWISHAGQYSSLLKSDRLIGLLVSTSGSPWVISKMLCSFLSFVFSFQSCWLCCVAACILPSPAGYLPCGCWLVLQHWRYIIRASFILNPPLPFTYSVSPFFLSYEHATFIECIRSREVAGGDVDWNDTCTHCFISLVITLRHDTLHCTDQMMKTSNFWT